MKSWEFVKRAFVSVHVRHLHKALTWTDLFTLSLFIVHGDRLSWRRNDGFSVGSRCFGDEDVCSRLKMLTTELLLEKAFC